MNILIIILDKEELLEPLAEIFMECGLFNTSIFDGEGVETIASQNSPLFNEIQRFFGNTMTYNRTIISAIPDQESYENFKTLLTAQGIDFSGGDIGFLLLLPCIEFMGGRSTL
ncbi:hypothetical protein [Chitinivibrio alkaliphilus]|uniref:Uncharacterized protein n=1 Tax=Chitinivibrio alkaliphilus ACht1 TaxID=1313304 RepID=U7D4S3_9BACT|nr:hypothetical protein [Chitinivibrio alkaliphilus]ERP30938.1 hypothetical protein CALK_2187 [Chitinivibrio alkaliphilus ACht1]